MPKYLSKTEEDGYVVYRYPGGKTMRRKLKTILEKNETPGGSEFSDNNLKLSEVTPGEPPKKKRRVKKVVVQLPVPDSTDDDLPKGSSADLGL